MDIVDELREEARDIPLLAKEYPQMVKSFTMIGGVFARAAAEIESLRAELTEQEVRRVGLLAEIAGLKSKGPFTVDESNPHLIYCEDAGVYLDSSQPQGVCNKLNQLTTELTGAKAVKDFVDEMIITGGDMKYHQLYIESETRRDIVSGVTTCMKLSDWIKQLAAMQEGE